MNSLHISSLVVSTSLVREVLVILLTLIFAVLLNSMLRSFIKVPKKLETRRGKTYVSVLRNIITLVIFYITLHIIFLVIGFNVTPLLASAGIIGITIGIGAQSIVKDLLAGFFLISQSTIGIGDYVNVGTGAEGTVSSIGLKNLTLIAPNGSLVIVPNGNVSNIVNYSYGRAKVYIDIPVKTKLHLDDLLALFQKVVTNMEEDEEYTIYKESKVIGVHAIDGNGITIRTLVITSYGLRDTIKPRFYYHVLREFEKKKLTIL